ncbi:MAG: inositol monophosphatase [Candidatus Kaiserbacteria bacterium]|nr:inositol monophosphatase [Candidatus Kaiserbacteria bacterium]
MSPVKKEAAIRGFSILFPNETFEYECVPANSGITDQPMSDDETRSGAIGRVAHARELVPEADFYVGLEGGVEEKYGDMYNFGWVAVESRSAKKGYGRTFAFVIPPQIRHLMLHEGLEQSHATDKVLSKNGTKHGTGTIGPMTNDAITYTDWYVPAVVSALIPFLQEALYPHP